MYKLLDNGKLLLPSLEYYAAGHCKLKCLGCTQSAPFVEKYFPSLNELQASLAILSCILQAKMIVILGGEPLLNPNLLQLIEVMKKSKIANLICIATNGLLIKNMNPFIWDYIDILRVSIYPKTEKIIRKNLSYIEEKCAAHNVALEVYKCDMFEFTVRPSKHHLSAKAQDAFDHCACRFDTATLYKSFLYKCSPIAHMDKFLSKFDIGSKVSLIDGIQLNKNNPTLAKEIAEYLNAITCLSACHYCNGSKGKRFPHRQLLNSELKNPWEIDLYAKSLCE